MNVIGDWIRRHFSDPQVILLFALLIMGAVVVITMGEILAPVLASVVIAYLLEGLVGPLEKHKIPRLVAVLLVFLAFVAFSLFLVLMLLPLLWQQVGQLFQQMPAMISWTQQQLSALLQKYPEFISQQQVFNLITGLRSELTGVGERILSISVASVRVVIWILVCIFLIPLLVFFFLKDKDRLLGWLTGFLPSDRRLATEVWREVDQQIGNYVRGKFWEILIVWAASAITFTILGLQFAMLISLFVGLSVLVPYIGATVMILPVAAIAYFQWGWGADFRYAVIAYVGIQILDGNLLAPLLFSEVVNLHPVAIIVAVLLFGSLWGFWGVFFAIPLATLVQAVLKAWLRQRGMEPVSTVTQETSNGEAQEASE